MVMDNSGDCGGWVEVEEAMEGINGDGEKNSFLN